MATLYLSYHHGHLYHDQNNAYLKNQLNLLYGPFPNDQRNVQQVKAISRID